MEIDYRATARRPAWAELPAPVRESVQARIGEVARVVVAGGGFTPAFAATVTTVDGERCFVKAADLENDFGQAIEREAEVLAALPPGLPVPRLRWSATADGWAVTCFDVIDGRMPGQPWTAADLSAVLAGWTTVAEALTAPTSQLTAVAKGGSFAEYCATEADLWRRVREGERPMPYGLSFLDHIDELAALESSAPDVTAGERGLSHFDLRADNLLLRERDGSVVVLDWNWLLRGPVWLDTLLLLATAFGEQDIDAALATHPTTRHVPAEHLDGGLAAVAGVMLARGERPPLPTSPFLRVHQRRHGLQSLRWLARRRGW